MVYIQEFLAEFFFLLWDRLILRMSQITEEVVDELLWFCCRGNVSLAQKPFSYDADLDRSPDPEIFYGFFTILG